MHRTTLKQRDYISGLRALAILPVVVYHAWPELLPGGFVGVSVFFVISGFLITYLISDELTRGQFRFQSFYARRVRRLLPAATVVFLSTFVLATLILAPDAFRGFGRSLVAADLLHANQYFAKTAGYFDAPSHEKPLLHFWSLSIEEQFYLIWPWALAGVVLRARWRWGLAALAVVLLTSLGFAEWLTRTAPDRAFYSLGARTWELMIGALLALVVDRVRLGRKSAEWLSGAGLAAIVFSCFWLRPSIAFPGVSALPACVGTAAVLMACFHRSTWSSRALSAGFLVYIGLISYSLYLWHWPVLSLTRYYLERPLLPFEAALLVITGVGLAMLSWRYVEQPFRAADARFRTSDARTLWAGLFAILSLAMLGGLAQMDRGWVWRFGPLAQEIFEQRLEVNPWEARCDNIPQVFADDAFCNFGRPKAPEDSFDVAVFGDSNADHFVPLIADYARQQDLSGRQVTQTACIGLLGVRAQGRTRVKQAECLDYQRSIVAFVERNPDLRLAIISGNWFSYQGSLSANQLKLDDSDLDGGQLNPESLEFHLRRTVEFFRARGIDVHLIAQIPYQDGLPIRCVLEGMRDDQGSEHCGVSAEVARASTEPTNAVVRRLADEMDGVTATIPTDFMCDDTICPIMMDGVLLYRDYAHLNASGARKLRSQFDLPELPPR